MLDGLVHAFAIVRGWSYSRTAACGRSHPSTARNAAPPNPGLVPWHRDVRRVLAFQVASDMCDQGIYPELADVKAWVAERLDAS